MNIPITYEFLKEEFDCDDDKLEKALFAIHIKLVNQGGSGLEMSPFISRFQSQDSYIGSCPGFLEKFNTIRLKNNLIVSDKVQ